MKTIRQFLKNNFPESSRKIYHTVNKIIYGGETYYCPICDKNYKKFLPGGNNVEGNSKCPGCSSLERQRLLWLYLTEKLKIQNQKLRLLNIAPDYAIQSKLKSLGRIKYVSIDLESNLAMQKQDLTNLTFSDSYFDAILCYHVLEHIEDDRKAMLELFRILKPGGWAILQTPIDKDKEKTFEDFSIKSSQERKKYFGQEDHVRIYGRDYFDRIEESGFRVIEDDFINKFSETEKERFVLDKNEMIFFCSKPDN
jgi:SAM-dependent methyltransferase